MCQMREWWDELFQTAGGRPPVPVSGSRSLGTIVADGVIVGGPPRAASWVAAIARVCHIPGTNVRGAGSNWGLILPMSAFAPSFGLPLMVDWRWAS